MDNRDLLFALLNAVYWLWEMIKDLLSLFFVLPYRIFRAALSMNSSDAIPFILSDIHSYLNRMKVHGITLHFEIKNGRPKFYVQSYFEETQALSSAMNQRKWSGTKELIQEALTTMKKCMFLTLEVNDAGTKFIQFHYDGNTFCFDFPLTPRSLNRDYVEEIIRLLRDKGFTKYNKVKGYAFKYKTYTIYPLKDDLTTINADFGHDYQLAVDLSNKIFKEIFHTKQIPSVKFG